jgi:hypothetical protein
MRVSTNVAGELISGTQTEVNRSNVGTYSNKETQSVISPFVIVNLLSLGVDEKALTSIRDIGRERAKNAVLSGGTSTSREEVGTEISYRLMDGNAVAEFCPDLVSLYEGLLLDLARSVYPPAVCDPNRVSAVNVNVLEEAGSRYERHVDSNPLTGLLFLTNHTHEDGGELLFHLPGGKLHVAPTFAHFLLFDARDVVHEVLPLKRKVTRVSCPMNFYSPETVSSRPPDLNTSLYT